jgi:tetratricopeptide (TPR) repeat protein
MIKLSRYDIDFASALLAEGASIFSKLLGGLALGAVLLGGCVPQSLHVDRKEGTVADSIPADKITTEPRRLAADGINHLDDGNLEEAKRSFNAALRIDNANSSLNFFAGLTYHLIALRGADGMYSLARQGYTRALLLDPSNWIAYYHIGLLELDLRNYEAAQTRFAEALILNSDDPDLLYNMATVSYYIGDAPLAEGVLNQLRKIEPGSQRANRASAMTFAALGDVASANHFALSQISLKPELDGQQMLASRLADWSRFHTRNTAQLTTDIPRGVPTPEPGWENTDGKATNKPKAVPVEKVETEEVTDETTTDDSEADAAESVTDENQMVIVDVVIIRTEENNTTAKGVNLLNSLTLELGSSSSSPAFQRTSSRSKVTGSVTRAISSAITIPSITYSLNIANTADTRNEILARPTLTAMNGQASEFFSGVSIKASTLSSSTGGSGDAISIEQDVGVKLGVTPTMLDDGRVSLVVEAERTFLNTPNSAYTGFTSALETSRTTVSANVAMKFGDTLILSGLSEKEIEKTSNGVPFLQDIPGVQYFFNRRTTTDFNRSVLLLITPRVPEYVYEKGVTDKTAPGENAALKEFRARYADWFRPYPSWASVFNHMQDNSLYREFRTGDVKLERWETNASLSNRLKRALGFLYY